jgi:hypothetical protein
LGRNRNHFLLSIAAAALLLAACGSSQPPAPPQPPPTGPGVPGPSQGLGANLEDQSPGTPLSQANGQQIFQALYENLQAYGAATVQAQRGHDYVVQGQYQQVTWTHVGQPTNEQPQIPTYQISGYGSGSSFSLQFSSRYEGTRSYRFASRVNLAGLVLYSTDQVALFEGSSPYGGYAVLKVAFRQKNPAIQEYSIEELPSYYGGQTRYHVIQKIFATQFVYPQQGQPNYQPTNYDPYYY